MKSLLTAALLSAVMLATSVASAADVVRRIGQSDFRGDIVSMSPLVVGIDTKPVREDVSVGDIDYISYDNEPAALSNARDKIDNGQYEAALEQLGTLDIGTISRAEIVQDIKFYYAKAQAKMALSGSGDVDVRTAGMNMAKFLDPKEGNTGSYHVIEANLLLGELVAAGGSVDNAKRYFGEAAKANWPAGKLEAILGLAQAYQRANQWEQALPLYRQVAEAAGSGPQIERLKLAAQLGLAASLAGTGKLEEGLEIVKKVILTAEKGDYALHGRAYNTLGAAYQAAQQPKDALLAYLHTDVLYFQDAEHHAESLANLAQLWAQVNNPQRQRDAEARLQRMYPKSRWANK